MHVNYYDFNKNSKEHKPFINHLKKLCKKYNVSPIPEIVYYGVEDATVAVYTLDNNIHLSWGCPWCEDSNEEEFKKFTTLSQDEWLNYLNPTRDLDEAYKKEKESLKLLSKDELIIKIENQKAIINDIKSEYNNADTHGKKVGLSMKMLFGRIVQSNLEEILNSK